MTYSIVAGALAAAVAPAATFTASYPSGKDKGNFFLAMSHKLVIGQTTFFFPKDFDLTFGTSNITVTNKTSASTWAQGDTFRLQLEEPGPRSQLTVPMEAPNVMTSGIAGSITFPSVNNKASIVPSATDSHLVLMSLGAPDVLDADGICAAQAIAGATAATINGALASSGAVTLDVPRGLQVLSSNGGDTTQTVTITGTDVYGYTMSEAIALNGTTAVLGQKAFKTVTAVAVSAAMTGNLTVGTTDVLGLPLFLPAVSNVIAELYDGVVVGSPETVQVPFSINQTDTLAGTAAQLVSPVAGQIQKLTTIVQSAIGTGGTVTAQVATTDVVGLSIAVADSATVGTVQSDTPTTPGSATTLVSVGSRLQVTPGSTFATSGALNGFLEIMGTKGVVVPGIRTAGGSTTTTDDVRGTYTPNTACDGSMVVQLLVSLPDLYAGIAQA